jgi:hypothetical protein
MATVAPERGLLSMRMEIHLFSYEWETLKEKVLPDSPAYRCLENPEFINPGAERFVEPDLIIICNEDAAMVILNTAKRWCPGAIPRISTAFRMRSRYTRDFT